jgi:hypothetical protein
MNSMIGRSDSDEGVLLIEKHSSSLSRRQTIIYQKQGGYLLA